MDGASQGYAEFVLRCLVISLTRNSGANVDAPRSAELNNVSVLQRPRLHARAVDNHPICGFCVDDVDRASLAMLNPCMRARHDAHVAVVDHDVRAFAPQRDGAALLLEQQPNLARE